MSLLRHTFPDPQPLQARIICLVTLLALSTAPSEYILVHLLGCFLHACFSTETGSSMRAGPLSVLVPSGQNSVLYLADTQ